VNGRVNSKGSTPVVFIMEMVSMAEELADAPACLRAIRAAQASTGAVSQGAAQVLLL